MSDVKLNDAGVTVDGVYLAIHGQVLELKDAGRYDASRGRSHHRKALVHETDDRLTINHGGDYKGVLLNGAEAGVTVTGQLRLEDDRIALSVKGHSAFGGEVTIKDLELEAPEPTPGRDAADGSGRGGVTGAAGDLGRPGDVLGRARDRVRDRLGGGAVPVSNDVSLRRFLQDARKEINELKKRVAELEDRART